MLSVVEPVLVEPVESSSVTTWLVEKPPDAEPIKDERLLIRSGDKSKYILGQKQAFNFRTILDPTLLKKNRKKLSPHPHSNPQKINIHDWVVPTWI